MPSAEQAAVQGYAVQIHLNLHYIIRYITNKVCNVSDKNAKKVIKSMFKNVADGKDVVVTFQN